ncbi:O-antigen ligase family protein [Abyssogena phaseoliformis symbiont]|uniref:O-antigen ligase family protein n=1 Tax=Abyssogena phaseoliformis symbiont TaxID=596095 RepID=UPI0019161F12|nr:O-antigen ligase family protein [Abyssogena phaseoliformis symbiont]
MAALIMAFIFYTKTRGAWLSIFIEFVLILVFLIAQRRRLAYWFFGIKVKEMPVYLLLHYVFLLINFSSDGWTPFWHELSSAVSTIGEDAINSEYSRYQIWQVAWHMIKDSPWFGTGLGTWFDNEIQGGYGSWNVLSYQKSAQRHVRDRR